jgi:hypothetical protein
MAQEPNPYSPTIHGAVPVVQQIRQQATWAAVLGVLSLLCLSFLGPFAVYFGHVCLRRIRQSNVGLEHRGAAQVGAILGWLGSAMLVVWLVANILDARGLLGP